MAERAPSAATVQAARRRIAATVRRTPLVPSPALSARTGAGVHLKLETLQDTGSFKVRGAANKILGLDAQARARGVVTVSTGNHGRAVAHVAGRAGSRATVCVSELVPENKLAAIRATGATLRVRGRSQDEAAELAFELERDDGLTMVNPFDDAAIIAGQGTIGLELVEDLPEIAAALVPVSGGGLVGGIALALKAANPACRVIGVSMDRGAAMAASQAAGKPVRVDDVETLADSLQGGIFLDNRFTFALVRDLVDALILVTEEEIGRAMAFALVHDHLVLEGGAAVGIAALLGGKVTGLTGDVALVLSGTNIDSDLFLATVDRHRDWVAQL